ncbi:MAG: PhnD/SsuA/transferrin family substrate-binding protein [Aminipila sp.]
MKFNKIFKTILSVALAGTMMFGLAACGGTKDNDGQQSTGDNSAGKKPIVMVWYPNESAEDYAPAREEFARLIEQATGRKVEQKLTTDYVIAIESIANGTASICFMGAQGYIEANNKSKDVQPLFVNSGSSGTLEDAIYYSFLNVKQGNEDQYKDGSEFSIDNIAGKKMSFVSNSSTSGFKVPTSRIIQHFSKMAKWSNLDTDMLIEGGKNMFFSEVMFGGSHQGSAVNLLTGKADVAAFADTEIAPYADLVEGEEAKPGAIYQIKENASAPFDVFKGEKFAVIQSTPVLNGPFAYNTKTLSQEEVDAIQKLFTSEEVTNNAQIFITEESGNVGMFPKSDKEHIVLVEDEWYNPIREMGN